MYYESPLYSADQASAIFNAVENGDFQRFKEALDKCPDLINASNEYKQTPFWLASADGQKDMIEYALNGPSKDVVAPCLHDHWGRSPMDAAKAYYNREIVEILKPYYVDYPF